MRKILLFAIFLLIGGGIKAQKIYLINTVDDVDDGLCNDDHCSLREAINAANTDGIGSILWFEINGNGTKVITLDAELPPITESNLIIEGNTLADNFPTMGRLVINGNKQIENGFNIQATDVKIYGLQIQNFIENAILIKSESLDTIRTLTIGRRKQGNLFLNNGTAVNAENLNRLVFQANYVGTNFNFDQGLGNKNGILLKNDWSSLENAEIEIGGELGQGVENYFANTAETAVDISYQGSAKIEGNSFGTGINGDEQLGNKLAIRVANLRGRIDIGGSPTTRNIFAYNENGVIVDRNNFVRVSENSFYCNEIGFRITNNAHPIPVIEFGFETVLTGRAQPNDFVEIYITDAQTCNSADCQGMTYIGVVKAGLDGVWEFPGKFLFGQQVVALSRSNGRQSMFSECFRICPSNVLSTATNTGPFCENDTIRLSSETDIRGIQWVEELSDREIDYEWTGPNNYTSFEKNPIDATEEGAYIFQAYLFGCPSEPDTSEVLVTQLSASIEELPEFCEADSIQLNSLITSDIADLTYNWIGPDGYESTFANPTNIKASGLYELIVSGGTCQSEKASISITNHFPEPFSLGSSTQICAGESITLSIPNFSNYQWSGDYLLPCDTCESITFLPEENGGIQLIAGPTANCTQSATLAIQITEHIDKTEELVLCPGSSLIVFNQTINASGTFSNDFVSASGCDSTHTYIVVEAVENSVYETKTICEGEVLSQFGQEYATSGVYEAQFTAANGCDSTHIVDLIVLEKSIVEEQFSLCAGETMFVFGNPVEETSTITKNFTAANGCDSIHTIAVVVKETYNEAEKITLCAGESTQIFNGLTVEKSGVFQRDFVASNGCDSVVIIEVEVLETIETFTHNTMCEDEAMEIYGNENAFPSDYSETLSAQSGCDSISYISFDFLIIKEVDEVVTVCNTDSYIINGASVKTSGIYTNTYAAANGCDSIHTIDLTVLEPAYSFVEHHLCNGEIIEVFGEMVNANGIFSQTFTNNLGCDSFHTVSIFIKENQITDEEITLCEGESVMVFDKLVESNEQLSKTFASVNGCDSTHTIQVNLLKKVQTESTIVICESGCIDLYGATACADKVYQETLSASTGCDSVHTQFLTTVETIEIVKEYTLCAGDSMAVFGEYIKETGAFTQSFAGANSCDSSHTFVLYFNEPIEAAISAKPSCNGQANGNIEVRVTGGMAPYALHWEGTNMGEVQNINNLEPGSYDLILSDFLSCQFQQKIEIASSALPEFETTKLDITCFGANDGSIEIYSEQNLSYSLNRQQFVEEANYFDLAPLEYEINIKDEFGCEYIEIFTIAEPEPLEVILPEIITINLGSSISLVPDISATTLIIYEWSDAPTLSCHNCENPIASPLKDTKYTLTIFDENNCESTDEIWVRVEENKDIYVPNVFSPNNDGNNDNLTILSPDGPIQEVELFKVYDRWGTLLYEANNFQPNDDAFGWDGTFKGEPMDNGVYIFVAVVKFIDGKDTQLQGDITLAK